MPFIMQKEPGGQGWHAADPGKELYLPASHSTHLSAEAAPLISLYLPISHAVHWTEPALLEYVPPGHSAHCSLFFSDEYRPAKHRIHPTSFPEDSLTFTRDPASHPSNTQDVLLLAPFVPKPMPYASTQRRHVTVPTPSENVPGKHTPHSAPFGSLRYEPAAHGMHSDADSFA
jgi:hypothetical protein